MTAEEIRNQVQAIVNALAAHEALLKSIRRSAQAHDEAIVGAIEANLLALHLLTQMLDEGLDA